MVLPRWRRPSESEEEEKIRHLESTRRFRELRESSDKARLAREWTEAFFYEEERRNRQEFYELYFFSDEWAADMVMCDRWAGIRDINLDVAE